MDDVYDQLQAQTGLSDRIVLVRAVDTALEALGASLSSAQVRETLAAAIEPPLRVGLRAGAGHPPVHIDDLYARVEEASGLRTGVAVEVVQMFFARLSRGLTPELRASLRRDLAREWSALIVEPEPAATPIEPRPHPGATPVRPDTLAGGRPGSTHPVADGHPPDSGHRESIAASDDPRAASKLASTRGLSQERNDRDLADAKPGADHRSLADYDES